MNTIYIIYICINGDVKLFEAHPTFNQAGENLKNVVETYIKNQCTGFSTKIIPHLELTKFTDETIRDDPTILNGYVFKMNEHNVTIYKKTTVSSWFGGKTVEKIGKIGIDEIKIQVTIADKKDHHKDEPKEIETINFETTISEVPQNQTHGKHVSLIEELKYVLGNRQTKVISEEISNKPVVNKIREKFIYDLNEMKFQLKPVNSDEINLYRKNIESDIAVSTSAGTEMATLTDDAYFPMN
jgi:hypothetical protein